MAGFSLVGAFFVLLGISGSFAFEGEPCGINEGTCMKVLDCPAAKQALMNRKTHGLVRCGFSGFIELVCCPPEPGKEIPPGSTTPGSTQVRGPDKNNIRKSKQACDDLSNEIPAQVSWQILGGEDAKPREFPHMAALGYRVGDSNDLAYLCGGSLISNNFILTAAHCIVRQEGTPEIVRLGKVDLMGNTDKLDPQDIRISNITIHPQYKRRTRQNDVALLRLEKGATTNDFVHSACLYNRNDDPIGMIATGWGQIAVNGPSSNILQKATLSPVNVTFCNTTYQENVASNIMESQLCAMSEDGTKDTCGGDSGGPLQVQLRDSNVYSIVGITSFGRGCGGATPGVYARVFSYLDWIESIVWT